MPVDTVKLHEEVRDGSIRAAFDHVWEMEEVSLRAVLYMYT